MNFDPMVWGVVADKLINNSLTASSLAFWLAIMVVTYFIGVVANAVNTYLLEKTGQAFVRDIRVDLFAKFENQSLAYHHETHSGELVTRIVSDVDAMEQSVLLGVTSLTGEIVTFIVVAGMVLWISPLVGSVSILLHLHSHLQPASEIHLCRRAQTLGKDRIVRPGSPDWSPSDASVWATRR